MMPLRKIAATTLVAVSLALTCAIPPARASSFSTDNSDLWWNPAESGWGLQLIQRADIIFVTLYLYNTNGAPTWYAAVLSYNSPMNWTGDLMQLSGPWFGTEPFDPAAVGVNKVGSLSFVPTSVADGTLSYSINGVSVSKHIERMTLRYDDYSGNYIGMLAYAAEGCPNPGDRGLYTQLADRDLAVARATETITPTALSPADARDLGRPAGSLALLQPPGQLHGRRRPGHRRPRPAARRQRRHQRQPFCGPARGQLHPRRAAARRPVLTCGGVRSGRGVGRAASVGRAAATGMVPA